MFMKRLNFFSFVLFLCVCLAVVVEAQEGGIEEVQPEDLTTEDFSLEDVEELPLPTDEELGIEIEGEQYLQPGIDAELIEEDLDIEEFVEVPAETTDRPAVSQGILRLGSDSGPEIYTIDGGDTLWDICERFFADSYLWPKLWAMNQYITNPHLIFPGDQLRFYMGTATTSPRLEIGKQSEPTTLEVAPVQAEITVPEAPPAEVVAAEAVPAIEPEEVEAKVQTIELKNSAFISPKKMKTAGYISHSGEEKKLLATDDRVYLRFEKGYDIKVGDRFHIIERLKKVGHPKKLFKTMGYLVNIKGVVRVTEINDKVITATVLDSWRTSKRDDRVIPYKSLIFNLRPKQSNAKVSGYILIHADQLAMIGQREIAFVDLGKKQGLEDGDLLYVVRQGDGVYGQRKNLPDVSIAQMTVVETMEEVSAVFINWTRKTLEVGDRVTTTL